MLIKHFGENSFGKISDKTFLEKDFRRETFLENDVNVAVGFTVYLCGIPISVAVIPKADESALISGLE